MRIFLDFFSQHFIQHLETFKIIKFVLFFDLTTVAAKGVKSKITILFYLHMKV
jgi:hypothetical protein